MTLQRPQLESDVSGDGAPSSEPEAQVPAPEASDSGSDGEADRGTADWGKIFEEEVERK